MKNNLPTFAVLQGLRKILTTSSWVNNKIYTPIGGDGSFQLWLERPKNRATNDSWCLVEATETSEGIRFSANFTQEMNGKLQRVPERCFSNKDVGMSAILIKNWLDEESKQLEHELDAAMAEYKNL